MSFVILSYFQHQWWGITRRETNDRPHEGFLFLLNLAWLFISKNDLCTKKFQKLAEGHNQEVASDSKPRKPKAKPKKQTK